MRSVYEFCGVYGKDRNMDGVLSEHLRRVREAGGIITDDAEVVFFPEGEYLPILCSEVIEVWTEDGRSTGRCGEPVVDGVCCVAHAMPDLGECEHGLSAALCVGPSHYPMD